tara:strand:- start:28214 stop:29485 length:1272 start_codon:yes stop_codon:yes gene_type:complete
MSNTTIFSCVFDSAGQREYPVLQGYVNKAKNNAQSGRNCMILAVDGRDVQVPGNSLSGGDSFMPGFCEQEHKHLGAMFYRINKAFLNETYIPQYEDDDALQGMGPGQSQAGGLTVVQQGIYTIIKVDPSASSDALISAINTHCRDQLANYRDILGFYRTHYTRSTLLLCFFDTKKLTSALPILYSFKSATVRIPLLDAHTGQAPQDKPRDGDQVVSLYDYRYNRELTPATFLRPRGQPRHTTASVIHYPQHADVMVCKIDSKAYSPNALLSPFSSVATLDFGLIPNGDMVIDLNQWVAAKSHFAAQGLYAGAQGTTTVSTYYPSMLKGTSYENGSDEHEVVQKAYDFTALFQFPGKPLLRAGQIGLGDCMHFIRKRPSDHSQQTTVPFETAAYYTEQKLKYPASKIGRYFDDSDDSDEDDFDT